MNPCGSKAFSSFKISKHHEDRAKRDPSYVYLRQFITLLILNLYNFELGLLETHDDCFLDTVSIVQMESESETQLKSDNWQASEDRAKRDPSYVYLRPILRQNSDL